MTCISGTPCRGFTSTTEGRLCEAGCLVLKAAPTGEGPGGRWHGEPQARAGRAGSSTSTRQGGPCGLNTLKGAAGLRPGICAQPAWGAVEAVPGTSRGSEHFGGGLTGVLGTGGGGCFRNSVRTHSCLAPSRRGPASRTPQFGRQKKQGKGSSCPVLVDATEQPFSSHREGRVGEARRKPGRLSRNVKCGPHGGQSPSPAALGQRRVGPTVPPLAWRRAWPTRPGSHYSGSSSLATRRLSCHSRGQRASRGLLSSTRARQAFRRLSGRLPVRPKGRAKSHCGPTLRPRPRGLTRGWVLPVRAKTGELPRSVLPLHQAHRPNDTWRTSGLQLKKQDFNLTSSRSHPPRRDGNRP